MFIYSSLWNINKCLWTNVWNERNLIIYKFDLCTRKWVCTRTSIYVQIKMDVHRRVGTYTVREAHWFESIFTGNNVSFNTNGIQCICTDKSKTKDRILICKRVFSKSICVMYRWKVYLNYLCYVQMKVCKKYLTKVGYVQRNIMYIKECYGTYTLMEAHWLKEISQGILSLEPMDSAYKHTDENKWKKFVYVWILTKMF